MLQVSELYIYPIKSLGGIALSSAEVTDKGFKYDRRWLLIDENNRFLSQRELPVMALLKVIITINGLLVTHSPTSDNILIPFAPQTNEHCRITIWDDICTAEYVSNTADKWFTEKLGTKCRLVYMPDDYKRQVDEKYAPEGFVTSFSDAYPFLIIGQASLDDLNNRLTDKLPINRFRPNIVFTGGKAYEEDVIDHFIINNINFHGVKLSARCILTTIDQITIAKTKEPLKTLAKYRRRGNDVFFGQNLIHTGNGFVSVGDEISIKNYHTEERFFLKA
jgi:uncharacterized protein YcbX